MENNCWEFNTSTEKVLLVERGKHFAKWARAASAPSAADVCPAGIYQRHTEADLDPILPDARRGREGETWRGAVPRQVKQTRHSRALGARAEEDAEVPSAPFEHHAAPGWGSVGSQAAMAGAAEEKGHQNRWDVPPTPEATRRWWKPPPPAGGGQVGQSREDCLSCIRDGASTTSPTFVRKLAQNKV